MTAELALQAGGATDVGQRRTHHEDTVLVRDDLDSRCYRLRAGHLEDLGSGVESASDDLLKALGDLIGPKS